MQVILEPILALFGLFACVAVVAVLSALLLLDKMEQKNIKLTKRVESLEGDICEWLGQPRKLLESDLNKGR